MLRFWLAVVGCIVLTVSAAASEGIEVESFTHDGVDFAFSVPEIVDYRGAPVFSVDVEIEVQTLFRPRDVEIGRLEVAFFGSDIDTEHASRPVMLNSSTYGTILYLDHEGATVREEDELDSGLVGALAMESGETHRGTLLFRLEPGFALVHQLGLKDSAGTIRKPWNEYIDLRPDEMDRSSILRVLSRTEIPAKGHMMLLEIMRKMNEFSSINEPLKDAW